MNGEVLSKRLTKAFISKGYGTLSSCQIGVGCGWLMDVLSVEGRRWSTVVFFFFLNDRAPTEIYPLPLPDALPIPRGDGPRGANPFFLPDAFASGPNGGFGNPNRQFFHGPGINITDFGISKRTMIREAMGIEIRAEFFNLFNHANFNNPRSEERRVGKECRSRWSPDH